MDWKKNRILSARNGTNPMLMTAMKSGYAVIGDTQFLPGYSVLLPKENYQHLEEMPLAERTQFLQDMTLLGEAVRSVTSAQRINYDILGNTDNFVHAHVFPRYSWEPAERLLKPVWLYDPANWLDENMQYSDITHLDLRQSITHSLQRLIELYY